MKTEELKFISTYPVLKKTLLDMGRKIYPDGVFEKIQPVWENNDLINAMLNEFCSKAYLENEHAVLARHGECAIEKVELDNNLELLFIRLGNLVILLNYNSQNEAHKINQSNCNRFIIPSLGSELNYYIMNIVMNNMPFKIISCYNAFISYLKKYQGEANNGSFFNTYKEAREKIDFDTVHIKNIQEGVIYTALAQGQLHKAYGTEGELQGKYYFEYVIWDNVIIITDYKIMEI